MAVGGWGSINVTHLLQKKQINTKWRGVKIMPSRDHPWPERDVIPSDTDDGVPN